MNPPVNKKKSFEFRYWDSVDAMLTLLRNTIFLFIYEVNKTRRGCKMSKTSYFVATLSLTMWISFKTLLTGFYYWPFLRNKSTLDSTKPRHTKTQGIVSRKTHSTQKTLITLTIFTSYSPFLKLVVFIQTKQNNYKLQCKMGYQS